jgi:aerobic-type carbon monoxide dehydrogenase small subunit (CoxS/CutS family)
LRDQPDADAEDMLRTLSGNLCRCGAHVEILKAARLAAQRLQGAA